MPFYPPLCRQARIQGQVILHFTVNERGDTSDVEAVTGHPFVDLLQRPRSVIRVEIQAGTMSVQKSRHHHIIEQIVAKG
jgi:hypothetical protein